MTSGDGSDDLLPDDASPSDDVVAGADAAPMLRVVRGEPTETELAAVVGVLAALAAQAPPAEVPLGTSLWANRSRALRLPPTNGPTAWRTQGWFRLNRN